MSYFGGGECLGSAKMPPLTWYIEVLDYTLTYTKPAHSQTAPPYKSKHTQTPKEQATIPLQHLNTPLIQELSEGKYLQECLCMSQGHYRKLFNPLLKTSIYYCSLLRKFKLGLSKKLVDWIGLLQGCLMCVFMCQEDFMVCCMGF